MIVRQEIELGLGFGSGRLELIRDQSQRGPEAGVRALNAGCLETRAVRSRVPGNWSERGRFVAR